MQNIKKAIIRDVADKVGQSWDNAYAYNRRIFNESLYSLDFDVTLIVDKNYRYERVNREGTPFLSLMGIIENLSASQEVRS